MSGESLKTHTMRIDNALPGAMKKSGQRDDQLSYFR